MSAVISQLTTYSYAELSKAQLYTIFELRQEVFVVEQDCVYQDIDGKDPKSFHVVGLNAKGEMIAYARLLPKGMTFSEYASLGRVLTTEGARGTGAGRELMQFCMQEMQRLWPQVPVKIQAQTYLLKFYQDFGFEVVGEEYLEDDIPHTDMVLV